MIIGRGLAAISHNDGFNSYLFYLLKVAFSNEDIIGNGAIFNSVGKEELNGFDILKPMKNLVLKFNEIAKNIDNQIASLFQTLDILQNSRDLLLGRLISGKLPVESLNIQFPPSMQNEQDVDHAQLHLRR
jgi:type I restriction enzyme, S subunit